MVNLTQIQRDLISANHILHFTSVLDAYGHISTRHPIDASTYLMSANMAPALVSNASNLVQYRVNDSMAVDPDAPKGYIERYIHGEMYKRYPDIACVVHSHSEDVLPYAIAGVPLRAVYHMAGFLGPDPAPLYDVENSYNATEPHDLLIRTPKLGEDLAKTFLTKTNESADPPVSMPDYNVVLMRRHGFTTAALDIQTAVFQAIFTQSNAKAQTTAMLLRGAFDGLPGNEASAWTGATGNDGIGAFEPLTAQQAQDCEVSIGATSDRPWGLWLKEVENDSLYTNNV
ncbi:Clas II Aldolase and Adducin domain-containing protein [Cladophialophora immunda]|nr:Clas II Aldolase and Adducin domain-containing protein [Cladophialophora immunda]